MVSLLIRLLYIFMVSPRPMEWDDSKQWNRVALHFMKGEGFLQNTETLDPKRPPIYPLFITTHYLLFGPENFLAVKRGFQEATGDYLIVQDADLELNPEDYPRLLEPVLTGKAEVVYGSRLLWSAKNMPMYTLFANRFLTFLINLFYNSSLTDIETGFKLLPTKLAKELPLECNGFDLDPEITIQVLKQGTRIFEVPVHYQPRNKKEGKKIHWPDGFKAIAVILRYKFKKVARIGKL